MCVQSSTVPHQPSSGNQIMVKNMTQLSQLTIGIYKGKKLFLAKKGQLINMVLFFQWATRMDSSGYNYKDSQTGYCGWWGRKHPACTGNIFSIIIYIPFCMYLTDKPAPLIYKLRHNLSTLASICAPICKNIPLLLHFMVTSQDSPNLTWHFVLFTNCVLTCYTCMFPHMYRCSTQ